MCEREAMACFVFLNLPVSLYVNEFSHVGVFGNWNKNELDRNYSNSFRDRRWRERERESTQNHIRT